MEHWHRLPREDLDAPSVEGLKAQVGWGPGWPDLVGDNPAHSTWLELDDLKGTF